MKFLCDSCEKYPCDDNAIKLMKYCPVYSPKPKTNPTNGDRIRSMTDEELAEFLMKPTRIVPKYECEDCENDCTECVLEWLKTEVDE